MAIARCDKTPAPVMHLAFKLLYLVTKVSVSFSEYLYERNLSSLFVAMLIEFKLRETSTCICGNVVVSYESNFRVNRCKRFVFGYVVLLRLAARKSLFATCRMKLLM